jgi:type I site-specific restriction endonuclease
MTDYSDRIDSFIEGLADWLHNVVNLFLVVGLAGTFFGMAEFARQTPGLLQAADPRSVLDALRTALGHSFPVGFLGLCLTIAGHPFASYYEGRLREAAKNAVNQALKLRTAALQQSSWDTLTEAVRKLPEQLAREISVTHKDFIDKLQPLLQLPQALQQSNQESLAPLRALFTESQKEWKQTVTKLDLQSKRVADAIGKIEQPILGLTAKINDIGELIFSTQSIVGRVLGDMEKVSGLTEELRLQVDGTAKSVKSAAEQLNMVPAGVRADLTTLHEVLRTSIRAYYETLGREYVTSVTDYAVAAAGEITTGAKMASTELTAAANSLRVSADAMTPELRRAIEMGAAQLRGHLTDFNAAFGQHFPKAISDLQTILGTSSQELELAKSIMEAMTTSGNLTAEHAQEWKKVEASLRDLGTAVNGNRDQMEHSAASIKASAEAHKRASETLGETVNVLKRLRASDGAVRTRWWTPWRKGDR